MNRALYLLVTSERPDTYLNSIVHCLLHEGIREINFVYIHGFGDTSPKPGSIPNVKKSATIQRWVTTLLEDLATTGEYRYFSGSNSGRKFDLRQTYPQHYLISIQELYRRCLLLDVQWSHYDILYSDLRDKISLIAQKKPAAIVDVTSINKRFIGDLVAVSVIEGLSSLYTFDLTKPSDFDHPWTMLFHDLSAAASSEAHYRYINKLDTQIFRECSSSLLVKKPSLRLSLILALALLGATLISYSFGGTSNWFVQITFLLSAIASIVSLFFTIYPLRR